MVAHAERSGRSARYLHNDHRGTTYKITDDAGDEVWSGLTDAYGVELGETGTPDQSIFWYQGQAWYRQEVGDQVLYVSPTRIYMPEDGRFVERDPLTTSPHYRLVALPNSVDPTGLEEYAGWASFSGGRWRHINWSFLITDCGELAPTIEKMVNKALHAIATAENALAWYATATTSRYSAALRASETYRNLDDFFWSKFSNEKRRTKIGSGKSFDDMGIYPQPDRSHLFTFQGPKKLLWDTLTRPANVSPGIRIKCECCVDPSARERHGITAATTAWIKPEPGAGSAGTIHFCRHAFQSDITTGQLMKSGGGLHLLRGESARTATMVEELLHLFGGVDDQWTKRAIKGRKTVEGQQDTRKFNDVKSHVALVMGFRPAGQPAPSIPFDLEKAASGELTIGYQTNNAARYTPRVPPK